METVLLIANIIVSLAIIGLIMLQGRGAGLGSAWGGGGEQFQTRRGVEKITFNATIVLVVVFFMISAVQLFVDRVPASVTDAPGDAVEVELGDEALREGTESAIPVGGVQDTATVEADTQLNLQPAEGIEENVVPQGGN